jgi:PGF-CTERM protein
VLDRRQLAVAALVTLVAASGCISYSYDVSVNADGTVERYELTLEMSESVFNQLENSGDSTLEERFRANHSADNYETVDFETGTTDDGNRTITYILEGFDPEDVQESSQASGVSIGVEDGTLSYTDTLDRLKEDNQAQDGNLVSRVRYNLTLPGEVDAGATNADSVDGSTVSWESTSVPEEFRAESELPETTTASDESGDDGGQSLPGFGPVAAVLALLGAIAVARRR